MALRPFFEILGSAGFVHSYAPGHTIMDEFTGQDQSSVRKNSVILEKNNSRRALRKSCDRCHELKLKCHGSNSSRTSCERCLRATQTCVYSTRSVRQRPARRKDSDKREGTEIGPRAQATPQHGTQAGGSDGDVVTSSLDLTVNNTDGVAVTSPLDLTANNAASYHPLDWSFMDWPPMTNYPDPLPTDDFAKPSMPGSASSYQSSDDEGRDLQGEPDGLARISEKLEETLLHATTTWRVQDIQNCMSSIPMSPDTPCESRINHT